MELLDLSIMIFLRTTLWKVVLWTELTYVGWSKKMVHVFFLLFVRDIIFEKLRYLQLSLIVPLVVDNGTFAKFVYFFRKTHP